jgi:hypothetical protein
VFSVALATLAFVIRNFDFFIFAVVVVQAWRGGVSL